MRPTPTLPPAMDRRIEKPRIGRRRIIGFVAAGVLAVAAAATGLAVLGDGHRSLRIKNEAITTGVAQQEVFHDFLLVRGQVAPLETTFVDSIEGGRVEKVLPADGAMVKAGELLAVLSNPRLVLEETSREAEISERLSAMAAQKIALQGTLSQSEAQAADAAHALLNAQRDLAVKRELHDMGVVSDLSVKIADDNANYYSGRLHSVGQAQTSTERTAAQQSHDIADTASRLQENLKVVRDSLGALQIRAPMSGRLTDFTIKPGQLVKEGDRLGQVDAEGRFKLAADVDEFYLNRVSVGQMAVAEIGAATYRLQVSRVIPQVTNGRFRVELSFAAEQTPPSIRRGQALDVRITLGQDHAALVAPAGPWLDQTGGNWVLVVRRGGREAVRRTIRVGRRNAEQVEILNGLKPGDQLVTSDYSAYQKIDRLNIE